MIDYRESDGFVAVATHGAGVFTTNINNAWQMNSVQEFDNKYFTIYPNPASNYLNINFENNATHKVTIYDLKGVIVKPTSQVKSRIDVQNLTRGVYILEVMENNTILGKRKFIVE